MSQKIGICVTLATIVALTATLKSFIPFYTRSTGYSSYISQRLAYQAFVKFNLKIFLLHIQIPTHPNCKFLIRRSRKKMDTAPHTSINYYSNVSAASIVVCIVTRDAHEQSFSRYRSRYLSYRYTLTGISVRNNPDAANLYKVVCALTHYTIPVQNRTQKQPLKRPRPRRLYAIFPSGSDFYESICGVNQNSVRNSYEGDFNVSANENILLKI